MPGFFSKIKGAFSSPSPSRKASKTQNDSTYLPTIYQVKEKELSKLHLAAWRGDMERVIELCRPDKINALDKDGRSPLHLAVASDHLKVVDHLISEGAKVNIIDSERRTPLVIATIKGNPEMLELLVKNSNNKNIINQPDQSGLNPLLYAIKNDNIEILEKLLKSKDLAIDFQDKDKNTAFHYAVIQRQNRLIDILIENGSDIDKQNADGRTPLMLAAKNGDIDLVDYLLDFNPDRSLRDNLGHTAQEYAESSGNQKCASLFTQHRPVKSNATKMYRDKRSTLEAERGNSISESNKKFENIFAAKSTDNEEKNDVSSKYKVSKDADAESNTSKILSYNKSDKVDTWDNSDEDEDSDDQMENENGVSNLRLIMKETNKLDPLFGRSDLTNSNELDSNIEININEDKLYDNNDWLFQKNDKNESDPSSSEFQVLTSFFPKSGLKKPKPELSKQQSSNSTGSTTCNWSIYVYTSRLKGAGTDASVYMQIYGSKANSAQFFLDDKKNSKKLFETGNCDRFDRNLPDIGKPNKIKIGHDNKGFAAGWHLEKVVLHNNISEDKYVFHCNRWLAKDEADHKTEVELNLDSNRKSLSVSSWNSDEEDSLSAAKPTPVKQGILLKQIDEEKGNESKNDILNPPGISDFDSSEDEKFNPKQLNSTKKSDQISFNLTNVTPVHNVDGSAVSFLAKNNLPKQDSIKSNSSKNDTIGQLVSNFGTQKNWKNPKDAEERKKEELNSSVKFLIENNIPVNRVDSDSFDDLVEEFELDLKPKNEVKGLAELMREEKKKISSFDSTNSKSPEHKGLSELMRDEKKKIPSFDSTHSKSPEPKGLAELMREEKNKRQSSVESKPKIEDFDDSYSEELPKPKGLAELMRDEKKKTQSFDSTPSKTPEHKGLSELMREEKKKIPSLNSAQSMSPEPKGLSELMRDEKKKIPSFDSTHSKSPEPKGLAELMREEKSKRQSSGDFFAKPQIEDFIDSDSEELPQPKGLSELMREEKNKRQSQNDANFLFGVTKNPSIQDFEDSDESEIIQIGLKDLIQEDKNKRGSSGDFIFGKNVPKPGLKDLMREQKNKKPSISDFADSDSEAKPEPKGLSELMREEKNKHKKMNDFLDEDLSFSKSETPQPGLKDLIRNERHKSDDNFSDVFNSPRKPEPKGLKELMRAERVSQASDIFDEFSSPRHRTEPKSETLEDLEAQFNDVIDDKKSPIKLLVQNSIPPPGFRNEPKVGISELLRDDFKQKRMDSHSIDSLTSQRNSPRKNLKVSFEESDEEVDEEIESLASPKKTSGSIGQGLGAFIGTFKDSPVPSPRKPSFYDIVPEMLNDSNDVLDKLKRKNQDLENAKIELEAQLKETEIQKKQFETGFNNLNRLLAEKEKLISQMNAEKLKSSLSSSMDLNREMEKLKDEKFQLEKQLAGQRSLRNSENFDSENESLLVKIKALENQIDELNKDRKVLADYKEELIQKIDEQEHDIRQHNEALQIVTLQFSVEKKGLNDEITKCKKELADLNELKRNLELLVESLKKEVSEKNLNYEKLMIEKSNFEKQAEKLGDDFNRNKTSYETELNKLKDEKFKLMERLAVAEAKLINTENNAHYTSSQIDERYKQIDDLKEQLIRSKTEFGIQLTLLQKEKEEKDCLVKKMNEMELIIQKNLQEISDLKLTNLTHQQELKDKNENINLKIENENKKLQNDVKSLSEKLFKTETELEKLKIINHQQRIEQSYDEEDLADGNEVNISRGGKKMNFNEKIHNELQKLRQDFSSIMTKYSNLETSNHELNESINSLKNGANRNDIVIRRDPVDVSAMITEVPLKTLTTLNSYLLQNLVQSKDEQSDFNSKSAMNFGQSNKHEQSQFFTNYSTKSYNCPKCCKVSDQNSMNGSYADILKYELSKRIELQVARELSLSGGFDSIKIKNNQSDNVDSMYSTMNTNTRYSTNYYNNSNNSDLLTSLRSKFLI